MRSILFITVAALALACGGEPPGARSGAAGTGVAPGAVGPAGEPSDREPRAAGGTATTPAVGSGAAAPTTSPDSLPIVLFLGNSLTAGYGLSPEQAFPALIQQKLDSAGLRFRAVNAGVSGETSAGGLRRIDWLLRQPVAVLVLELGANDALRGQDLNVTRRNLQAIIDRTRERYPDAAVVIAGMQAPPNLGESYTSTFRRLFVEVAESNDAALIPFLLEGVAADPALNQADGVHPSAAGQRILAENVWRVLEPVLREVERRGGGA